MLRNYINIGDERFRVSVTGNTAEDWEALSGLKLGQFEIAAAESAKTGGLSSRPMLLWLFCAIREGERLDGREFTHDFVTFKSMVAPSIMTTFAPIFIAQYMRDQPKEGDIQDTDPPKKKIRKRCRFFKSSAWRLALWVGLPILFAMLYWLIFSRR